MAKMEPRPRFYGPPAKRFKLHAIDGNTHNICGWIVDGRTSVCPTGFGLP